MQFPRYILFTILLVGVTLLTSSKISGVLKLPKSATYTVTVHIGMIRNLSGHVQLQIYRDQASFKKELPWKQMFLSKSLIKDNKIVYKVTGLTPGTYGFALLDDENKDSKMNFGFFLPKEGYAFSDFVHTSYVNRPTFNDFKFELKSNKTVSMVIRYM